MLREAIEISARVDDAAAARHELQQPRRGRCISRAAARRRLAVALEGRERIEGANRSQGWLSLQAAEIAARPRALDEARGASCPPGRPAGLRHVPDEPRPAPRRARAAARRPRRRPRALLEEAGRVAMRCRPAAVPRAARRAHAASCGAAEGDLDGARAAVDDGRRTLLADDTVRVARLAALGARIEADAAARARDLGRRADDAAAAAARAARHADEAAARDRGRARRSSAPMRPSRRRTPTRARGDGRRADQLREAIERSRRSAIPTRRR